jgi:hypothetical protein
VFPAPPPQALGQFQIIVVVPDLRDRESHGSRFLSRAICSVTYHGGEGERSSARVNTE